VGPATAVAAAAAEAGVSDERGRTVVQDEDEDEDEAGVQLAGFGSLGLGLKGAFLTMTSALESRPLLLSSTNDPAERAS